MRRLLALAISLCLISCAGAPIRAPVGDHTKRPVPPSGYHRVVRGETLFSIAWQYELDADNLARWNDIGPPYTIYARQRLRLMPPPPPAPPPAAPVTARHLAPAPTPPEVRIEPSRPKFAAARAVRSAPPSEVRPSRPKTDVPIPAADGAPVAIATAPAPELAPPPEHQFQDKLQWTWPAKGLLLRHYDSSSPGKKGISIAGSSGDDVLAAASGKVVYAGSGLSGYGRLIIIKHNQQYLSAYAHNKELLAREGDWVDAGQPIAHMGSSGTSRTQLYFEIRKNQTSVDPLSILPQR